MKWVLAAAVLAAFVLGLLFLNVYRKRPMAAPDPGSTDLGVVTRAGSTGLSGLGEPADVIAVEVGDRIRADADAYSASTRRLVEVEIESSRQLAEREAEAIRRAAQADAASMLRTATSDATIAQQTADAAQREAERSVLEAQRLAEAARRAIENDRAEIEAQQAREQAALDERAAALARADAAIEQERAAILAQAEDLDGLAGELKEREHSLQKQADEHLAELERVAALSVEDAKTELMRTVEIRSKREAAILARSIETEARTEANERARFIIVEAVQRCASEQTTETVVSVMHLPSDEMKGRIIGREGRNIRAFEAVTGVNVVIDDTPEAVLLSCFDPTRREVGRLTLEKLVLDGRIHPHRIEEAYEQSKAEVDALCLRAALDALADVGISTIDERLLPTLGRLKYRTSYGQNVLGHLVETAHISGVMAAELGLEPTLIKRCAFLHDIGKALTHEVQGSHAIIGAELLRRYGESEAVAHAVEAHHNEVQPRTVEAVLTQASDSCSAARPGARRETLESYIKRLQRIEEIANAKTGVERVFAMQAGREVRVMVQPETIDDLEAQVMAREIAKQIEDELTYPGQIRVTVVRELRATETAH